MSLFRAIRQDPLGSWRGRAMSDTREPRGNAETGSDLRIAGPSAAELGPSTKTPMYETVNALRYQRQALIRDIEAESDRRLLCYVSGKAATIDRDDVVGFMELLHNVTQDASLD